MSAVNDAVWMSPRHLAPTGLERSLTIFLNEASSTETASPHALTLPQELILLLLNEESGYFHQVPGWNLHCAVAGAVLAELSLQGQIDTDIDRLIVLDTTPSNAPVLEFALAQLRSDDAQRSPQFWVERLAAYAELAIDLTLDRLTTLGVLEYHDGNFWTLAPRAWRSALFKEGADGTPTEFIVDRIKRAIFDDHIPSPRDVIIIALANECDVLHVMFNLDEAAQERIQLFSQMDQIGRSLAAAVSENITRSAPNTRSRATSIPQVPLRRVAVNKHMRRGNIPAAFAQFTQEYGPVFQLKPPFAKEPMTFVSGVEINRWVHRHGRMYLRSAEFLRGLEHSFHAAGLLPALDGSSLFRMRKSVRGSYARDRLEVRFDEICGYIRNHIQGWKVDEAQPAVAMCRRLALAHIVQLLVGVDGDDLYDDIAGYMHRVMKTEMLGVLPKFMLKTRRMQAKSKAVDVMCERVLAAHTAAQREGCPFDHADEVLSLHRNDPVFMPKSNLRFVFAAPVGLASPYVGDALSFLLYSMITEPGLQERIQAEADAVLGSGKAKAEDLDASKIDVTHRLIQECLRVYPLVPMAIRHVMNPCVIEGHEFPIGSRLFIVQSAPHYMPDVFPDPHTFDIDRYVPSRGEHRTPGYAPFGLGTHQCLGHNLVMMQLALVVLMVAHHFELEVAPTNYKLKISVFPSLSPDNKLKFKITKRRHAFDNVTHSTLLA